MHSSIRPNPSKTSPWLTWLTTAALVLLLALVLSRGTMHENLRDATPVNPNDPAVPHDAGPAASLMFDIVLMLPAGFLTLRGCFDEKFELEFHWSHGLLASFAGWAWLSVIWADDQFAAAVNATHLIAAAAAMWAATQLFRDGLRLRLLAGVCGSLLLIFTANGLIYRLVDVPENIHYWQEHRDEELSRRGWKADSFQATQFEKKLASGEMIGFSTSPNTFAAALVLVSIVLAGAIIQRIVDRDEWGWPITLGLPLLPAAWILTLTQSKAAVTAPVLAALLLLLIALAGPMLRRRLRLVYGAGLGVAALVIGGTVAFGITQHRLPSASLAFRWHYWIGSWRIFTQHPWLGIGWSSFANRYLAVRLPVAAEEVKDPHNFAVRSFVELGVLGGGLVLAWVARLVWEMLQVRRETELAEAYDRAGTARIIGSIAVLGFTLGAIGAVDFTSNGTTGWYITLQLLQRALYFGLMLLALAATTLRSSAEPLLDRRPAPWIARGVAVAVGIFLIQNLIDFSLFEPGTTALFAVVAGAAVARYSTPTLGVRPTTRTLATFGAWVLILAITAGVWLPVAVAESHADAGDDAIRAGDVYAGSDELKKAFEGLWIRNSDYAFRAALALERAPGVPIAQVLPWLQTAIDANRLDPQAYRNRAAFLLSQPNPDAKQIIADYAKAAEIDPNEVSIHLEFADALTTLNQRVHAREELQLALHYNDLLNPDEPKRLSEERVAQIQARLAGAD